MGKKLYKAQDLLKSVFGDRGCAWRVCEWKKTLPSLSDVLSVCGGTPFIKGTYLERTLMLSLADYCRIHHDYYSVNNRRVYAQKRVWCIMCNRTNT